jgi:hypothetical protein
MKKSFLIPFIVGAATVFMSGFAYIYFFYYNKPHRDVVFAEPDYALNAKDFSEDFVKNPLESNQLYLDKIVEIVGTVKNIHSKDSVVVVEIQDLQEYVISFRLLQEYSDRVSSLEIDEYTKIKGIYDGYQEPDDLFGEGVLMLKRCIIVK